MRKVTARAFTQWFAGILISLYTLLLLALDFSSVQSFLGQTIEEALEEKLKTDVTIGRVEIGLFNSIQIHDVSIKDKSGKSLLRSKLLFAKIELTPLLRSKISLRNIALLDAKINLYKPRVDCPINAQFIIDAFKSKDHKKSNLDLRVNSLILRRGTFTYDQWDVPRPIRGQFSINHIGLNHVELNLSLKQLTNDSLNLRLRHLAADEQCGFSLKKLKFRLAAGKSGCEIQNLELVTAHSNLTQQKIRAHYVLNTFDDLLRSISLRGQIDKARISSKDVAHFVPRLAGLDEEVRLDTKYDINRTKLSFQNLHLQNANRTLDAKLNLQVYRKSGAVKLLKSNSLHLVLRQVLAKKLVRFFAKRTLPVQLESVGDCQLNGKSYYRIGKEFSYDGDITSSLGKISSVVKYADRHLLVSVFSENFNPSLLSIDKNIPRFMKFRGATHLKFTREKLPEGSVKFYLFEARNEYSKLTNVSLDGTLQKQQLRAHLILNDPAFKGEIKTSLLLLDLNQSKQIHLESTIEQFNTKQLGLASHLGDISAQGNLKLSVPTLDLNHLRGELEASDVHLVARGRNIHRLNLNSLSLTAIPNVKGMQLRLRSDIADLDFVGPDGIQEIRHLGQKIWSNITSKISGQSNKNRTQPTNDEKQQVHIALRLKNSEEFSKILQKEVRFVAPLSLIATAHRDGSTFRLFAAIPQIEISGNEFKKVHLSAENSGNDLKLLLQTTKPLKDAMLQAELSLKSQDGKLHSLLQWDEQLKHHYAGSLSALSIVRFSENSKKKSLFLETQIDSSQFKIRNDVWSMNGGQVSLKNGNFNIDRIALSHADQNIIATGSYSPLEDGIRVYLNKIDVASALSFTGLEVVNFGGIASGNALIHPNSEGKLRIDADLSVPKFFFNHSPMGQLEVKGGFDAEDQRIFFDGVIREPSISHTDVQGYVSLKQKKLDIEVQGKQTSLAFLDKYVDGIFEQLQGRATGKCRVFGPFKAIDFEGYEKGSATATVPVNGVTYHLNEAEVSIKPGVFELLSANLTDSIRGRGSINGLLRHEHLRDMTYDFAMMGENMKLYDKGYENDMPFYSTAYGTGDVRVWGSPGKLNANIDVHTDQGSTLTFLLDSPDNIDRQLLTFRDKEATIADLSFDDDLQHISFAPPSSDAESKTDIRLNMNVNVRPDATLRMVTDAKSGDVITIHGSGPIQATYYNKGNFQMFGTYNIHSGVYDMSIQNVIRKTFKLNQGGTVHFSGSPTEAEAKVQASYMVNSASLADLNIGSNFANNTTPVNCLIYFTGQVGNLNLKLDFDLPNVSDDEKLMVRNLVSTDEERTTQVLYLLSVGRFFTYNYSSSVSSVSQSQSSVMMKSLLASTLSSQLNNVLTNALGTSNWNIGTNLATGQLGWSDMELDGSLSGRMLNNRLLFNGKVGYHERQAATTNFVGDFDVQYLLTPNGAISLKAYSETNNRYFTKSTLTTQGVGIQFKHDFVSWWDLFRRKQKLPMSVR